MTSRLALLAVVTVALALASCTGMEAPAPALPPQAAYGAIAYSVSTGFHGVVWDVADQQVANQLALSQCGRADCEVLLSGPGCGALAAGPGIRDVATAAGATAWEAKFKAVQACMAEWAVRCGIRQEFCNSP